jgi:hypothetical protein
VLEYVDNPREDDRCIEYLGCKLFIDPKSCAYLNGMEIDYVRNGLNEGFQFRNVPFITDIADAFCQSKSGAALETACNSLTQGNCGRTSCCVWTSDNKCKSGNANGPIFNTGPNGKTMPLDYYYFQLIFFEPNALGQMEMCVPHKGNYAFPCLVR